MAVSIAECWFEAQPQAHNILRFSEKHVNPYSVGDIWFLRGSERCLVIDTGSGIIPPEPVIQSYTDKPLFAVALNCFYDHAGGWRSFSDRACHPLDAESLRNPERENAGFSVYLKDESFSALPWPGFTAADYRMIGAEATRLLNDGDAIDLGDRSLEVLHVPGRSPGGIALWEAATGSLFTSDMLYDGEHGPAWPPDDPASYVDSLLRLQDLPVVRGYPGHYGPFGAKRMMSLIDEQTSQLKGLT